MITATIVNIWEKIPEILVRLWIIMIRMIINGSWAKIIIKDAISPFFLKMTTSIMMQIFASDEKTPENVGKGVGLPPIMITFWLPETMLRTTVAIT